MFISWNAVCGPTLWKVFGLSCSPTALGNSGVQSPAWWKPLRAGVFAHRHGFGWFDLQGAARCVRRPMPRLLPKTAAARNVSPHAGHAACASEVIVRHQQHDGETFCSVAEANAACPAHQPAGADAIGGRLAALAAKAAARAAGRRAPPWPQLVLNKSKGLMSAEATRPLEPGRAGLRGERGDAGGGKRGWSGRRWLPYGFSPENF